MSRAGSARAFVGLGSNLGDRGENLRVAVDCIEQEPEVRVLRCSSFYESEPVGVVDQPWFVNGVVEIETTLSPRQLLECLKRIEQVLGRQPSRRWGERLIDLDLLLHGEQVVAEDDLVVPHPEMWNRLFVLKPLSELLPVLESPDGRTIREVIAELEESYIVRPLAVGATD